MRRMRLAVVLALAFVMALAAVGAASAAVKTDTSELRQAVTTAGIMEHEERFQAIADANGGTRVTDSPGYEASVDYVTRKLRAAGYRVEPQRDTFDAFEQQTPSVFERVEPTQEAYTEGFEDDFL